MDGRKRLPDAELSVMQAVWAHGGEVSRGDIEGALASHGWSVNTINTYLTRLCDKGYLSARREGRSNFYTPLVSQEKYREFDSRSVLQRLYGGSLGSFVAALTAEKPLAQSEIDELRRYLDEMSGKAGEGDDTLFADALQAFAARGCRSRIGRDHKAALAGALRRTVTLCAVAGAGGLSAAAGGLVGAGRTGAGGAAGGAHADPFRAARAERGADRRADAQAGNGPYRRK